MNVKRKKLIHYTICGLDYVYLENVPVRQSRYGDVLAVDVAVVERAIAREIIRQGIPLRGAEVRFLRKCLGMSLEKFGSILGLSAPAILKWERMQDKRLQPINEVAVKAMMAEQLGIELEGKFTLLKGLDKAPARLSLRVA
jgi:DNA-binding transcriptional regulator YiaG